MGAVGDGRSAVGTGVDAVIASVRLPEGVMGAAQG